MYDILLVNMLSIATHDQGSHGFLFSLASDVVYDTHGMGFVYKVGWQKGLVFRNRSDRDFTPAARHNPFISNTYTDDVLTLVSYRAESTD